VWILRRLWGICLDGFVGFLYVPSTGERPNDQPDEQDGGGDYPTSVTTESSPAMWTGTIRRVDFALHDLAVACLWCEKGWPGRGGLSQAVEISRAHDDPDDDQPEVGGSADGTLRAGVMEIEIEAGRGNMVLHTAHDPLCHQREVGNYFYGVVTRVHGATSEPCGSCP